ncbi:MAG: hypothetical protein QF511_12235 [Rhodospirillales bacterium]|jgi:signal transduction histidine kinase|nr:hypothetical protein [Rhodospirillales bacterium]HIJ43270.1 hypothetical protein [Rhodospirillaceae bacterium]HJO74269.1 hypothetical protein [Rhodospirillales bacterium]
MRDFVPCFTIKPNGMGLPICRGIIKTHHGRLWTEAATGDGTVFKFTLAAAERVKFDDP